MPYLAPTNGFFHAAKPSQAMAMLFAPKNTNFLVFNKESL